MKALLHKVKTIFPYLPWLIPTLRFNLHYFPFKQAIQLPVLLTRPVFLNLKGVIRIEGPVKSGMIRIGQRTSSMFPQTGTRLDLNGTVVFKGECQISSCSVLCVGKGASLVFGNHDNINDRATIICYSRIELGDYFNMSWDGTLCDNDFHVMKRVSDGVKKAPYAPIIIGDCCWVGQRATLLKGTTLPPHTTVQACALVTGHTRCPRENSIIGGNPAGVLSEGMYFRDFLDDTPDYPDTQDA